MPRDELIDKSIASWNPRYGRQIKREEASEIIANLTGCIEILLERDREEKKAIESAAVTPEKGWRSVDPVDVRASGGVEYEVQARFLRG